MRRSYRVCIDEHLDHWVRDLTHAGNVQRGPTVQIQRLRLRVVRDTGLFNFPSICPEPV
eukprot:COSAG06_NODE_1228_length_10179_cov_3.735119_16_plen_59_part_00